MTGLTSWYYMYVHFIVLTDNADCIKCPSFIEHNQATKLVCYRKSLPIKSNIWHLSVVVNSMQSNERSMLLLFQTGNDPTAQILNDYTTTNLSCATTTEYIFTKFVSYKMLNLFIIVNIAKCKIFEFWSVFQLFIYFSFFDKYFIYKQACYPYNASIVTTSCDLLTFSSQQYDAY